MQRPILLIVAAALLAAPSVGAQPRARNLQRERKVEEAPHVYGPAAFEAGLRHVIARSVEFETAVSLEFQRAAQAHRSVSDLYALPPLPTPSSIDVEQKMADALSRPTTEDDTHPGPADRFRLIKRSTTTKRGATQPRFGISFQTGSG